jgi:ABC-type multidrug transport system fused ATPase/permease subunit
LLKLETNTKVSRGILCPGPITFNHVGFSYPKHANAPVLGETNLQIAKGKCVTIVGPSGARKSTVAALLQRLYRSNSGSISIGTNDIAFMDVTHLRHHISVVNLNFFDTAMKACQRSIPRKLPRPRTSTNL